MSVLIKARIAAFNCSAFHLLFYSETIINWQIDGKNIANPVLDKYNILMMCKYANI